MEMTNTEVFEKKYINSIFTAPVRTIYNHDIMNCTSEEVTGNYLYSGRALGLTDPGDIIQLSPELKTEWPFITRHYHRIGLSFTRDVIWSTDFYYLQEYHDYKPSFFYYGNNIYSNYENSKFFDIVNYINSKNNFMNIAEALALPVPQTLRYETKNAITDTSSIVYPCYLKAAVSVSGVGIYRCASEAELLKALATFDESVPLQIQEEVQALSFLNVQYRVTHKGVERFAATDQLLDGFAHKGNSHPTQYPCWELTDPYAEYLYANGMQGVFAFDVAVSNKDGR
ncbi:MAG: ATP-grasp domain-containing protein, partial [Gammaproteobacteria bacterium]|nr:ATP-grasp domain-containing protein [Gammaproteobacteria bacterium]